MRNPYERQVDTPGPPRPACEDSWDIYDSDDQSDRELAIAICGDCRVTPCGFRRSKSTPTVFEDCGSHAAIGRHRRAGESLDLVCREWRNALNRAYRARKAERRAA